MERIKFYSINDMVSGENLIRIKEKNTKNI